LVYRIFLFCGEVAQRRARQNGQIGTWSTAGLTHTPFERLVLSYNG
jgi:hypothetical protein